MLALDFHPDIFCEVNDSYIWYESKYAGLGDDFLRELDLAFSSIQEIPETWPLISKNLRRFLLKRFPFGVIYSVKKDRIFVVAVMHLSRKPGYWTKRIV